MVKIFRNGYSLVEALISIGLLGVMVGLTMNIVVQMNHADQQLIQFNESMILTVRIADSLKDPANCEANFKNFNPTTNPAITAIISPMGPIATVGALILPTNIKVTNIAMTNYYSLGPSGAGVVEMQVVIDQFNRGQAIKQRSVPIFLDVIVNASNLIVRCQLAGSGSISEAFCNSVGGTMVAGLCTSLSISGNFSVAGSANVTGEVRATSAWNALNLSVGGALNSGSSNTTNFSFSGSSSVAGGGNYSGAGRFHTITSAGPICIGGVCRTFAATSCAGGLYSYGVDADGTLLCRAVPPPPPPPPPPPLPP